MKSSIAKAALLMLCLLAALPAAADEQPQRGGILKFTVGGDAPSLDGHRDSTFTVIHLVAPFYSTLIRINPKNAASTTDIVCDLCTEMPKPTDGGLKYRFAIRRDVKFHDGTPLTAKDVHASWQKIVFPPAGVASNRKGLYSMIEKIEAPDDYTVEFTLKYPTPTFVPALAIPQNFIYPKAKLDADMRWFEKNVLGSGPFKFVSYEAGRSITGVRNDDYYIKGLPYLDGFEAIIAPKESVRMQAIRGDRAATEFRGIAPKARDELVTAMGKKVEVQETDWNCAFALTPNHRRKPFDDARVRRAVTLSIDRWGGSKYLSEIAILKTVGGVVFPRSPLAAKKEDLQKIPGYWPDLEKSRAEARRLLAEAGVKTPLKVILNNRATDQPYKTLGTWIIDQLRPIGFEVVQQEKPSSVFFDSMRTKKDWDLTIEFLCPSIVNPVADISKFLSEDVSPENYGAYADRDLDKLYDKLNRTQDEVEQAKLIRAFENRVLNEEMHTAILLWMYRIVAYRSYMRGWQISPSHHINQDLATVWIDKSRQ
ncbi:MAG: ABC transporter substrate-binding protein [Hyphomicrobiaceae bacterium]